MMRVAVLLAMALGLAGQVRAAEPAKDKPLKVCMLSGSAEYKSDQTLAEYKAWLEKNHSAQVSLHLVGDGNTIPDIDKLESCDVILVYTRRVKLPPDQVATIQKLARTRPIVGLRTASHAFQTWLEFDAEIIGGSYKGHYGTDTPAKVTLSDKAKEHPVLRGVKPFGTSGKLYKNPALAADVTLLLTASTGTYAEPVAWTREHDGVRVFYTSLGVPDDFASDEFRRLLANALFWAAGR